MESSPNWYEGFFSGLWLTVQRQAWTEEQTASDGEAIVDILKPTEPLRILDVPCGNGRISLDLARRGHQVTGVDFTPSFLESARESASAQGRDVDFRAGDMRELAFDNEFDAAICMWGSLGYGTEDDDRRTVAGVARALKAGGVFILDLHVAETLLVQFEERSWYWAGDVLVAEERAFDHATGRCEASWTFQSPREREQKHSSIRIYTYRELANLLSDCGLEIQETFGSMDLEPFEVGSSRLVLAAAKVS